MSDARIPYASETLPRHWRVQQAKTLYDIQLGKMLQTKSEGSDDTEIEYLKAAHVQWQAVSVQDLPTMWASPRDIQQYAVANGDLLVCEGGEVGRAAIVDTLTRPTIIQNALHRMRPCQGDTRFFMYFLHHVADTGWFEVVCNRATISHLTGEKLRALLVPTPPLPEQRAIADFLDRKTKTIDDFIQKKERLIELLQEKRQTLITQAVTQGLDPAVPMKDSGIEWLGEIPAHWNLQRVKHLVSFITSGSRGWAEYFSDDGAIFLQSGNLDRQLGLDLSNVQHVQPPKGAEGIRTRVRKDDVLVCITGALTGNVSHVHSDVGEAYVNQHLALVRPKNTLIHPRLLAHALASDFGQHQFWMTQYGGTKQGLGLQDVRDVILPIPPQAEQSDLLEKLEVQLGVLTRLRTRINYQVLRLREYRQALISAAVTGKIDVTRETA